MTREEVVHGGKQGELYITTCSSLLGHLQELNLRDRSLPKNASGLSRRLKSAKFEQFSYLTEESAPDVQQLRRKASVRYIGLFVQNDTG